MKSGDPINLEYVTYDNATNVYVVARLVTDGVLNPTPILLDHIGNGIFSKFDDVNIVFPANAYEVRAVYSVYLNAILTVPSPDHGQAEDIYRSDECATRQDVEDVVDSAVENLSQYRCNMTTTLNTVSDTQEVLCWLDINNQTIPGTLNARVEVYDGNSLVWDGSAATPDSRGVFKITKTVISALINTADKNYTMSITIEHAGFDYTTVQPFYTVA